jgi:hypothetical protein
MFDLGSKLKGVESKFVSLNKEEWINLWDDGVAMWAYAFMIGDLFGCVVGVWL